MVAATQIVAACGLFGLAAAWRKHGAAFEAWAPAQQTDLARNEKAGIAQHLSPPVQTEAPSMALLERAVNPNTCGFIVGPTYQALTCDVGYTCTNSNSIRDCCTGTACQTQVFSTACLDATAPACQAAHPGTWCCTYNLLYPYCITYLWSTSATPGTVFTLFNCDRLVFSGMEILAADTPSPTSTYFIPTTVYSTPKSTPTPSSTTPASSSTTTTVVAGGSTSGTSSSGSSVNVGAIVGGVVGGVAVLGLIGLAILFLVRRHKAQNEADAAASSYGGAPTAATGGAPSMAVSPSPGPAVAAAGAYGAYDANKHYSVTSSTAPSYGQGMPSPPVGTGSPPPPQQYGAPVAGYAQGGYGVAGTPPNAGGYTTPMQQAQYTGGSGSVAPTPTGYYGYPDQAQPQGQYQVPQQQQQPQQQWGSAYRPQ